MVRYRIISYNTGIHDVDRVFVVIPDEVYRRVKESVSGLDLSLLRGSSGIDPLVLDFRLTCGDEVRVRGSAVNDGWCDPYVLPLGADDVDRLLEEDTVICLELTGEQLDAFIEPRGSTVCSDPLFSLFLEDGDVGIWMVLGGETFLVPLDGSWSGSDDVTLEEVPAGSEHMQD